MFCILNLKNNVRSSLWLLSYYVKFQGLKNLLNFP
nr:MAG TPA: hypothetical protein [Inoviridae sp.]